MKVFPAYRVVVNSRFEMEEMHREQMNKLNEITWLQKENRKDINLIFQKLGMNQSQSFAERILLDRENENYVE